VNRRGQHFETVSARLLGCQLHRERAKGEKRAPAAARRAWPSGCSSFPNPGFGLEAVQQGEASAKRSYGGGVRKAASSAERPFCRRSNEAVRGLGPDRDGKPARGRTGGHGVRERGGRPPWGGIQGTACRPIAGTFSTAGRGPSRFKGARRSFFRKGQAAWATCWVGSTGPFFNGGRSLFQVDGAFVSGGARF